jgi:hypothetical protein
VVTPDAFLTELYVLIDDWNKAQPPLPPVPGPAPALSTSETITLAMTGQFAGFASERDFWRYAERHWRGHFPTLPDRAQFNRAVRRLRDRIAMFGVAVARLVTDAPCPYEIVDGTGIATRNLKRRGLGWLPGEATIGQCTRLGWYEGVRLLLATTPAGVITGWGVGPANTNDRRLADTFLMARATAEPALPSVGVPLADTYLADKGFAGIVWETRWRAEYHAVVIAPPEQSHRRRWPAAWRRWLAGKRQIVETATDRLLTAYGLARERPHALSGLLARLGARIALHNVCCYFNHRAGRPLLAYAGFLEW